MAPPEFHLCLDAIWLNMRTLAELLKADYREVRRWGAGSREIPEPVAAWLRALRACHDANRVPVGWRRAVAKSGTAPEA